jgi:uncharacterized protein
MNHEMNARTTRKFKSSNLLTMAADPPVVSGVIRDNQQKEEGDQDTNNDDAAAAAAATAEDTASVDEAVMMIMNEMVDRVQQQVQIFYQVDHADRIQESHGFAHVLAVLRHAQMALLASSSLPQQPPIGPKVSMQIQLAALLHDVDDHKYFPRHHHHENARALLARAAVADKDDYIAPILLMIDLVSCSANGNHVPECIVRRGDYHWLIPRWADRLEAVGAIGVVRCYQYNIEHHQPLCSTYSPRAVTAEQVWQYATTERFVAYQERGGTSSDMISHYYDKLLHVARPPQDIVRNTYLEQMAEQSALELVEVCIRYGQTGRVDEEYILHLARQLGMAM